MIQVTHGVDGFQSEFAVDRFEIQEGALLLMSDAEQVVACFAAGMWAGFTSS